MRPPAGHRSLLAAAALAIGACGGVPRATVAPVSPGAALPAPSARRQEIAPESIIEVVGADTITGDHVVKVRRFHGTVSIGDLAADPRSRSAGDPIGCDFVVDTTSLSAESSLVEDFIKSPRFLDVRRFPEARFVTTRVQATRDVGAYLVVGRLTLHGVEKEISFPATLDRSGAGRVRANFLLPRRAFGLVLSGIWETLLEDDIRVRLDLVLRAPTR